MARPDSLSLKRLVVLLIAASSPLGAAARSGEFTFVVGETRLVKANGQTSTPAPGIGVDAGDRIETGDNGMVQLTMVDGARLSLRPRTRFVIEQYGQDAASEGAVLNLLKGTLRTFTGALAQTNREKYIMKTHSATVGIRGSGNILYACDAEDCDASVTGGKASPGPITVNHTIEGAHAVTNLLPGAPAGLPPQQGGATTLITGPGQTALVLAGQPPRYIPTPAFIAKNAITMAGEAASSNQASEDPVTADAGPEAGPPALPPAVPVGAGIPGAIASPFPTIDATINLRMDPVLLHDVVIGSSGSAFLGQAVRNDLELVDNALRGYRAYTGTQSGVTPIITGGSLREALTLTLDSANIRLGRYENAALGLLGPGSENAARGSVHWIVAPSGYPGYLTDVLTGTARYTLAAATSPTDQHNTAGVFGQAFIDVNFSARSLGLQALVTMPAAGGVPAASWQITASNVPISLNTFFASTHDRMVVVNQSGQSSATNSGLTGSLEGSFVGTGLGAAILGYGIGDATAADARFWRQVSGVAAFTGPRQDAATPYREGRVSDPAGTIANFVRSYATTNRPEDVTSDAEGRVSAFSAPFAPTGGYSRYSLGSAQVMQQGFDPETGMVWGRWSNGVALVTRGNASEALPLQDNSLHYLFAGSQSGPVALPLTGSASYDVIGSTSPTGPNGVVGSLGSATLDANFTNRTANAGVVIAMGDQTWSGTATNMPIYRGQYFSAYAGAPVGGLPNPNPLVIGCQPGCGANATGSFDGFFTGRTGQGAGLLYNLGGNSGIVAFRRRGG